MYERLSPSRAHQAPSHDKHRSVRRGRGAAVGTDVGGRDSERRPLVHFFADLGGGPGLEGPLLRLDWGGGGDPSRDGLPFDSRLPVFHRRYSPAGGFAPPLEK